MSRTLDRRRFLALTAATLPTLRSLAQPIASPTLTLHPDRSGLTIPDNFIGLSYETQQLSDPAFFSAENTGLIAQFKALTPTGVLRLGGNTSDVGWWKPTPATLKPEMKFFATAVGEPTADLAYPITPQAVLNLCAFLDATGWTCLYGINLGTNTPAAAADQAAFVARTLGWAHASGKLQYFQLGNEPDLFDRHLRDPATWSADLYFDQWLEQAEAITRRVPEARYGLPDTAGNPLWYAKVVARLTALGPHTAPCPMRPGGPANCATGEPFRPRPNIAALSHHYYFGGPPSNPDVNIPALLRPEARVPKLAADIRAAAAQLSAVTHAPVPYRMTEGNTCYRGGKPGVSDVFASALWAADYLLTLASSGYAGVNLHGGTGKFVANSLGGHLPGDDLVLAAHGDPASHPHPYYTPIADFDGTYRAEPVLFGMAFAQRFAGATLFPIDFNPTSPSGSPVNATAYAARRPSGQIIVAVINKDATQPVTLNLRDFSVAWKLTAPALDSRSAQLAPPDSYQEAATVAPASAVILESIRA